MGNSFVLFDVSIVISRRQFHHGIIGYTQTQTPLGKNLTFPWAKGLVEPQLLLDEKKSLKYSFFEIRCLLLFYIVYIIDE